MISVVMLRLCVSHGSFSIVYIYAAYVYIYLIQPMNMFIVYIIYLNHHGAEFIKAATRLVFPAIALLLIVSQYGEI